MTQPFLGEIRIVGFTFAPRGWAMCNGQILAISQNTALFSLLGTYYGGNGTSTFALPDIRGNVPIHQGQGAGLSSYVLGQMSGEENPPGGANGAMAPNSISSVGGGVPHNNMQPYLVLNFIIAMQGIFPVRN